MEEKANMVLLLHEERNIVKKLAREYYEYSINGGDFKNPTRKFGVEVEFSTIDRDGNLCMGIAEKISDKLFGLPVVPELGSYQIEVNPPPINLDTKSFGQLHSLLRGTAIQMRSVSEDLDLLLLPIGLPLHLEEKFFNNREIYTNKQRYQISAEFSRRYGKGSSINFTDGNRIFLPEGSGVTIINELHIQLQATSVDDVVNLFNYSQMLTPLLTSLGANSGITNGKPLSNLEHQIRIFEECEGFFDGKKGVPRVGLFPGYIKTLDDYFDVAFSFRPLYAPEDKSSARAFELMSGTYYSWTRIRHGINPTPHLRIEFRPLSTQPTLIENVAISEYFIKSLLFAVSQKVPMLPQEVLQSNFDQSIRMGMNAMIYWNFGKGVSQYPVSEILQFFYSAIGEGEFLKVINPRINKSKSPANRLIEDTLKLGQQQVMKKYIESYNTDNPYLT